MLVLSVFRAIRYNKRSITVFIGILLKISIIGLEKKL